MEKLPEVERMRREHEADVTEATQKQAAAADKAKAKPAKPADQAPST